MSKSSTTTEGGNRPRPANRLPAIHPGEVLAEELATLGLSARAFGAALNVPHNRVSAILKGTRAITADTALRLARYFGTSPRFWMDLQQTYDLKVAEAAKGEEIRTRVRERAA